MSARVTHERLTRVCFIDYDSGDLPLGFVRRTRWRTAWWELPSKLPVMWDSLGTGRRNIVRLVSKAVRPSGVMFQNFIARIATLWRRFQRVLEERTVLVVTLNPRHFRDFRIMAIQESWHVRFAPTLPQALKARPSKGSCVVAYDRDLPGVDWRRAVTALSNFGRPVLCIVLSQRADMAFRKMVIECGGFDVTRKPLDRDHCAGLVNGALALATDIDSIEVSEQTVS
jgi:hypothetical protein